MKCPNCAAVNPPGALACAFCEATLASNDSLGAAASTLDARFTDLASKTAALLAAQTLPAVTAQTLHLALAQMGANVARMRDVLDAEAAAIPAPTSPQEVMVWLRRAPALVWVSYTALGHTRNFTIPHLARVLTALYRDRTTWEPRDPGLPAVFAQHHETVRSVEPSLRNTLTRAARTNPMWAMLVALLTVSMLWSMVGGGSHPRSRRSRRRAERAVAMRVQRG